MKIHVNPFLFYLALVALAAFSCGTAATCEATTRGWLICLGVGSGLCSIYFTFPDDRRNIRHMQKALMRAVKMCEVHETMYAGPSKDFAAKLRQVLSVGLGEE